MAGAANCEIVPLSADLAADSVTVSEVTALVNEVYRVAEEGLWLGGADRTTVEEVAGLIRAEQIVVARINGQIAGCVKLQRLDDDTSEFGMLAAAPTSRGTGVGRELVRFAEQHSLDAGRGVMQLELLVPREWAHPSKVFLAGWYSRIGYQVVRTGIIDEAYPRLAALLATPCDFLIYRKNLKG